MSLYATLSEAHDENLVEFKDTLGDVDVPSLMLHSFLIETTPPQQLACGVDVTVKGTH